MTECNIQEFALDVYTNWSNVLAFDLCIGKAIDVYVGVFENVCKEKRAKRWKAV